MNVKLIIHKSKQKPYYQRIITKKYMDAILCHDSISELSQVTDRRRETTARFIQHRRQSLWQMITSFSSGNKHVIAAHYIQPRRQHPTCVQSALLIAAINLGVWMFALQYVPDLPRIPASIIITTHLVGFVALFLFHPNPARAVLVEAEA